VPVAWLDPWSHRRRTSTSCHTPRLTLRLEVRCDGRNNMMRARPKLGREFAWLWSAYAVSSAGTWLAFNAFPLIAIVVLHAGPAAVSALAAAGLAVGALAAIPLGPWIEFRRKRPVMMSMDVVRCAAVLSVPLAYSLHWLTFVQLLFVSVIVVAADISFKAASGAFMKSLVSPDHLHTANARFESTMWTCIALGPPLGGLAIGILGPVTTVIADASSYLLSALCLRKIGAGEPAPTAKPETHRARDVLEGWRYILTHAELRPLFFNTVMVNGLIMAVDPLLAVLMLRDLGFPPWQYGLAFGVPCIGGLIGARVSRRVVARFGRHRVLVVAGAMRACWLLGLVFVQPGWIGLATVIVIELGLISSVGVFNPTFATYRLDHTTPDRVARTLTTWSVTSTGTSAVLTALWGVIATVIGLRFALGLAGAIILGSIFFLPWRSRSAAVVTSSHTASISFR
jgi:predicted MFS family arabinose efflux permease